MDKLIIEVAINETVTRAENPHVPLTMDEIVRDAAACVDAGASIVHFHPRNPDCPPDRLDIDRLDDVDFYSEAIQRMRRLRDVIPYPTNPYQTHAGHDIAADLYPHVRTLVEDPAVALETFVLFVGATSMGWWNAQQGRFTTDRVNYMLHSEAVSFLTWCKETGFRTQFGVREAGHVRAVYHYQEMGLVPDPVVLHLNFSDGPPFGPTPGVVGIQTLLNAVPVGKAPFQWFIHNFVNNFNSDDKNPETHRRLNMLAIAMGGHVRTGIGDLPLWGGKPLTNAQMVEKFARMARDVGREIATAEEAREILRLRTPHRQT